MQILYDITLNFGERESSQKVIEHMPDKKKPGAIQCPGVYYRRGGGPAIKQSSSKIWKPRKWLPSG
jgi:hypothetical protein